MNGMTPRHSVRPGDMVFVEGMGWRRVQQAVSNMITGELLGVFVMEDGENTACGECICMWFPSGHKSLAHQLVDKAGHG